MSRSHARHVPGRRPRRALLTALLCALVLCTWCAWVSGFHRATTPARVTWAVSLAAVVVVDVFFWQGRRGRPRMPRLEPVGDPWPGPGRGGGRRALVGVSPWLTISLVVLVWEVLGLNTGKHEVHLTISALTQAFRPLNAAMLLVWMLVGIGYGAARARAPVEPVPAQTATSAEPIDGGGALGVPLLMHSPATALAVILPDSRPAGVAFWLGVVGAGVVVDQLARRTSGRLANGEELVRFITAPVAANVLLVVAWTYAGYHLFAH